MGWFGVQVVGVGVSGVVKLPISIRLGWAGLGWSKAKRGVMTKSRLCNYAAAVAV